MLTLKELKISAKQKGLKNYSTMKKAALKELLELDSQGQAPAKHMTNKRKKELISSETKKETIV